MLRITRRRTRRPSSNILLNSLASRGGAALAATGALAVTAARAATQRQQPPSRIRRVATNKLTWLVFAGAAAAALSSKGTDGRTRARGVMDRASAAGNILSGRLTRFGGQADLPQQPLYAAASDGLDERTPTPATPTRSRSGETASN